MTDIEQPIDIARRLHTSGNLEQAEQMYRDILAESPNYSSALQLLGIVCSQQGRMDQAIAYVQKAIALEPNVPEFHANMAWVYLQRKEPAKAVLFCQNALKLKADQPDALINLATALRDLGNLNEAVEQYKRALAVTPDLVEALHGLSLTCRQLGRWAEAVSLNDRVLKLAPMHAEASIEYADSLLAQNRYPEAAEAFRKLISSHPERLAGYNGLGLALFNQGREEEAAEHYLKAIELAPHIAGPYNNLGLVRITQNRMDEAVSYLLQALELKPDLCEALNNLGYAYTKLLKDDLALAAYDKALFLRPDHVDAHWNKAILLLRMGDFKQGWPLYEWRWLRFSENDRHFKQPLWAGEAIEGKTILLHAEQGYGDTLQFVRFARMVAAKGATVNLECQREIMPLVQRCEGIARTIARGDVLMPFDFHCPLLSLPYALNLNLEDLPATEIPYLKPDPNLIRRWSSRIAGSGDRGRLKVGLAWSGASRHARDRERSAAPSAFESLADVPDVSFFSLQKWDAAGAPVAASSKPQFKVFDFSADLHDFAETAALIANLDLVIAVDTSVVHLAGAMGKEVWTLLPNSPDWRWLLEREDSPWYPTMRLFRQKKAGDWQEVMLRVKSELQAAIAQQSS